MMEHIGVVQGAQAAFAERDECAAYVTVTDDFEYPPDDPWHYTTDGFIQLGQAFAEAVIGLQARCAPTSD